MINYIRKMDNELKKIGCDTTLKNNLGDPICKFCIAKEMCSLWGDIADALEMIGRSIIDYEKENHSKNISK